MIREEVRNVFHKSVSVKGDVAERYENPIMIRGGEERIIAWQNTIVRDKTGQIIGTLSSGEDITERKRTEAELISSEKLASISFENLSI